MVVAAEDVPPLDDDEDPEILLVDPDPASRAALRDLIGPLARVAEATTGEEALSIGGKRELAAILIDVALPGIDGFQTVTQLRRTRHARNVPVLFVSENAPDWLAVRRGYHLGGLGYMTKPVDAHALRAKLEVLLTLFRRGVALRKRDEMISRLSEANRAKDVYMGVLGHDLRNPLSAILMSARKLLLGPSLSPEDRISVSRIGRNADRMAMLIRDILDFTRERVDGALPIVPRPSDMAEICAAMIDELSLLHPERRIDFRTSGQMTGKWDRGRVEQVVSNLLANSLTHGTGDIQLVVDGTAAAEVVVSVHNAGAIPAQQIANLFEPFRPGASSRMGLGLGLYIVKQIVKAHGGDVDVSSSVEHGTRFRTRWPRHVEEVNSP